MYDAKCEYSLATLAKQLQKLHPRVLDYTSSSNISLGKAFAEVFGKHSSMETIGKGRVYHIRAKRNSDK
jgi:hypothetical protein